MPSTCAVGCCAYAVGGQCVHLCDGGFFSYGCYYSNTLWSYVNGFGRVTLQPIERWRGAWFLYSRANTTVLETTLAEEVLFHVVQMCGSFLYTTYFGKTIKLVKQL